MDENRSNWRKFYEKALGRPHSQRTERAIQLNDSLLKVAVDCGCGTGSDIEYLKAQGYNVHGFDINPDSVAICRDRFGCEDRTHIVQASFSDFSYPESSVIIANASLFFVEPLHFQSIWKKIESSLTIGGVFAGDFMGENDTWASEFHLPITALSKEEVLGLFANFEIIECSERDADGTTMVGDRKHWHTYSVVAVKRTAES